MCAIKHHLGSNCQQDDQATEALPKPRSPEHTSSRSLQHRLFRLNERKCSEHTSSRSLQHRLFRLNERVQGVGLRI